MRKYIFATAEAQNQQLQGPRFTHQICSNHLPVDTGGISSGACSNVYLI